MKFKKLKPLVLLGLFIASLGASTFCYGEIEIIPNKDLKKFAYNAAVLLGYIDSGNYIPREDDPLEVFGGNGVLIAQYFEGIKETWRSINYRYETKNKLSPKHLCGQVNEDVESHFQTFMKKNVVHECHTAFLDEAKMKDMQKAFDKGTSCFKYEEYAGGDACKVAAIAAKNNLNAFWREHGAKLSISIAAAE